MPISCLIHEIHWSRVMWYLSIIFVNSAFLRPKFAEHMKMLSVPT